jgi:hypothetical protein
MSITSSTSEGGNVDVTDGPAGPDGLPGPAAAPTAAAAAAAATTAKKKQAVKRKQVRQFVGRSYYLTYTYRHFPYTNHGRGCLT